MVLLHQVFSSQNLPGDDRDCRDLHAGGTRHRAGYQIAESIGGGAERLWGTLGAALQVFVAAQATGIINIAVTLFTVTMPINIIGVFDYFHGRVNHTMNGFNPDIMNRIIMGNMAIAATGTPTRRVITAVQGGAIGATNRLVRMARTAEFVITGVMNGRINNNPRGHHG